MPKDALHIYKTAQELEFLVNSRIERVNMPDKDTVILNLKKDGKIHRLLICCGADSPRLHLTNQSYENPSAAMGLLMHLRKHIGGGIIKDICGQLGERVVTIGITAFDELFNAVQKRLIIELMGKYSNIILVNQDNTVSQALKHIPLDGVQKRAVLPKIPYLPVPVQSRIEVTDTQAFLDAYHAHESPECGTAFKAVAAGLAPQTIDEAFIRAGVAQEQRKSDADILNVINVIKEFYSKSCNKPCVLTVEGAMKDYYFTPYRAAAGDYIAYPTLNEAMDAYYRERDGQSRWRAMSKNAKTALSKAIDRAQKRLGEFEQKLLESSDAEQQRIFGELITANIYNIKQGQSTVTVDDYINGGQTTIKLDPFLSPQKNAAKYFKAYSKKKRAAQHCAEMKQKTSGLIDALNAISDAFRLCQTPVELNEIESELRALDVLPENTNKNKKKAKPSSPDSFNIGGFCVIAGKNNTQNELICSGMENNDIWLHAQKIHGAHVLIKTQNRPVPNEVILAAASIAAYRSKAYMSQNVPVDYTQAKYVKKPKGCPLGFVNYTNQKTVYVKPKQDIQ